MFVIGRNVKVKVEDGRLTIVCQIENIMPSMSLYDRQMVLATTQGIPCIPKTDLHLKLILFREITK